MESFRHKGGGRKFSLKPEEDEEEDENKLVIKDGRVKPKSTEERAKIPKLKCSLLQNYARSRGVTEELEEEQEEDLLVPERRLNLLLASPSITRRRPSLVPGWSGQQEDPVSPLLSRGETAQTGEEEGEEGEGEEISLLSIPKMLLRRASTQLGFKGLGSLTQPDQEMKTRGEPQSDQSGQSVIAEETMEEIEGEEILEVKYWLYLEWLQ